MHENNSTIIKVVVVSLCLTAFYARAGDLELEANFKSTAYAYQTQRGLLESENTEALVLEPSLTGIYDSKKVDGAVNIAHTLVEQSYEADGADKNYTDIKLNSTIHFIDNALQLSISGVQNYRADQQSQITFSDKILSAGDLSQVQQYAVALDFHTPNPAYLGFVASTSYSDLSTDNSVDENSNGLDSESFSVMSRLYSGKELRLLSFDLTGSHSDTKRSGFNNFKSDIVSGNIRLNLVKQLKFVITGSESNYDIDQTTEVGRRDIDSTSIGAGLELSNSDNRRIKITYNRLKEAENETNFIGVDLNWAFNERTSLDFNYGKRFYGDAYTANARYNLKNFRSNLSYTEAVTTFSSLNFENVSLGVFVCRIGATELADCFQPESLNYVLQPGEEFRAINGLSVDISNEVILSKSAHYSLGYSKRKLKISFDMGYRETEYIESNRLQRSRNAGLTTSYQLNSKMNFGLDFNFLRRDGNESFTKDDTFTANVSAERQLSKNAKVDLALRYLDRQSEDEIRDVTDKRLTIGFNYQF